MQNYEKLRVTGRGAMGTCYLCRCKIPKFKSKSNSLLVLKEIPIENLSNEERSSALNEAEILKKLNHPNIIRYHDSFLIENNISIVMEYGEGGTLYNFILNQEKIISENVIKKLFIQLLAAVDYIHSNQILHRDLKTENILLDKRRKVLKISDFGISKVLATKSKAWTVVGTPCYISPELCQGRPYNQKSDIFKTFRRLSNKMFSVLRSLCKI